MTREELDDRIARKLTEVSATGGVIYPNGTYVDDIKQLIRDCIEAVTPAKIVTPKMREKHPKDWNSIKQHYGEGRNGAISDLKFYTKELLG